MSKIQIEIDTCAAMFATAFMPRNCNPELKARLESRIEEYGHKALVEVLPAMLMLLEGEVTNEPVSLAKFFSTAMHAGMPVRVVISMVACGKGSTTPVWDLDDSTYSVKLTEFGRLLTIRTLRAIKREAQADKFPIPSEVLKPLDMVLEKTADVLIPV